MRNKPSARGWWQESPRTIAQAVAHRALPAGKRGSEAEGRAHGQDFNNVGTGLLCSVALVRR